MKDISKYCLDLIQNATKRTGIWECKKCSLVTKGFEINTECLASFQRLCLEMAVISHIFLTRTDSIRHSYLRGLSLFFFTEAVASSRHAHFGQK